MQNRQHQPVCTEPTLRDKLFPGIEAGGVGGALVSIFYTQPDQICVCTTLAPPIYHKLKHPTVEAQGCGRMARRTVRETHTHLILELNNLRTLQNPIYP